MVPHLGLPVRGPIGRPLLRNPSLPRARRPNSGPPGPDLGGSPAWPGWKAKSKSRVPRGSQNHCPASAFRTGAQFASILQRNTQVFSSAASVFFTALWTPPADSGSELPKFEILGTAGSPELQTPDLYLDLAPATLTVSHFGGPLSGHPKGPPSGSPPRLVKN